MTTRVSLALAVACLGASPLAAQVEPDSGWYETAAGRIYYEQAGRGPALVFLHDGIGHREIFDAQFREFAATHHVVRFDHRGFGRSDPARAPYDEVEDLTGLFDRIGVGTVTLIAGSGASSEAVDYALTHPSRVQALVLVGPTVRGLEFSTHFIERNEYNSAPAMIPEPAGADLRAAHERWMADPYLLSPSNDAARDRLRRLLEPYVEKHGRVDYGFYREPGWSTFDRLGDVRVPTLIVVGEHDIPDVHAHAGAIEAGLPGGRRLIVRDAGHLVYFEQPDVFNRLVNDFLREDRSEP